MVDTPCSIYQPSEFEFSTSSEIGEAPIQPRQILNEYLASKDISPVRSTLITPWEEASERTKRHYKRKAKQIIDATLEEIAPQDHEQLFVSVSQSYASNTENVDSTLMEAIKECYINTDHWSTRRQILSIVADKMSFQDLHKWIPDLSRYRYNIARHHRLLHGRGAVVPVSTSTRMYIEPEKLDHFLTFITSTHIVQDLPFGVKSLKLSSNTVIKVPNVIRSIIPDHIVKQYQSYCRESGFTPMSRSTLCRILNVCSATVRKSLQGIDYVAAEGAKAFDNLEEVVEKLGDIHGKSLTWAKGQNEKLKNAKRYLKTDYKVLFQIMYYT